jgi:hypothetical protein
MVKTYMQQKYRQLLVWLQLPLLYERAVVWWEFHSSLRDQLKALRMFVMLRSIATRDLVLGSTMLVARRQIQSRSEFRDMTHFEIMDAYRSGRLEYMMHRDDGIAAYGGKGFGEWVKNGGQRRHNITTGTWR